MIMNKPEKPKKMMNTVFRPTIMADKLKGLGFTYKMNVWRKGEFSIAFYKHLWKASVAGSHKEYDVIYMDQLYPLYWELTGKVLPRVQKDEI